MESYKKDVGNPKNQLSLWADSHASHSVQPGSEEARKMTVTSGLQCLKLSDKSGPLGLLEKTLLGSSEWASMMRLLTWRAKVTNAGHLLYQLVPLVPATEGTGHGLLPTPTTFDHNSGDLNFSGDGRQKPNKLPWALSMLPTPTVCAPINYHESETKRQNPALATKLNMMLPTPESRDYKGANSAEHLAKERGHHDQLPNSMAMNGLTLQPEFVEWMLGYPEGWTEPSGLKPSEIQ